MILVLTFVLTACMDGGIDNTTTLNTIKGQVIINGAGEKGVNVSIEELSNKSTLTDANGVFELKDISDGSYTLIFSKQGVIENVERLVTVSGGNEVVQDLDYITNDSLDVQDAKDFVNNLNNTGQQMMTSVNEQMNTIGSHFTSDIGPYMESLAVKLGLGIGNNYTYLMGSTIIEGSEVPVIMAPGTYEITFDSYGDPVVTQINAQTDLTSPTPWVWEFSQSETDNNDNIIEHSAKITLTNLDDIMYSDDAGLTVIDLSVGEFSYSEEIIINGSSDPAYNAQFNFSLSSSAIEDIEMTNDTGEKTGTIIIPRDATASLSNASIFDNYILTYIDGTTGEKYTYEPVGNVSISGTFDFNLQDTASDKYISFDGSFDSEVIDSTSGFKIEFSSFPTYQSIFDNNSSEPIISSIKSNGSLTTDVIYLEDGYYLEFNKSNMLTLVELNGTYKYIDDPATSDVDETTILSGGLSIVPDYTNYDSSIIEGEDNYIGGNIDFAGTYTRAGLSQQNWILH
jgi:hypothetical protein